MKQRAVLLLLVVAGAMALYWSRSSSTPASGKSPAGPASATTLRIQWQGAASCAAAACHNGNGLQDQPRSEYTTWISRDRHAQAYQVLFNDVSRKIATNLRLEQQAHEATLCLNCHVHPHFDKGQHSPQFTRMDGVGCESCHGPAQHWIGNHYRAGQGDRRGMRDTKSLLGRARVCVECHVGTAGSEVNHDLIAAGHPRLRFEFGAYHANLARHWSDARDKAGHADFEAQAWVVGQLVSARAALQLLAHRAKGKARSPWPELAEFNCYSCHHDLRVPSCRQQENEKNKRRVRRPLLWNDWYFAMLPRAVTEPDLAGALADLKTRIENGDPDRAALATRACEVAKRLTAALKTVTSEPGQLLPVRKLFDGLTEQGQPDELTSWDHVAQFYLARAALYNAMNDLSDPRFTATPEPRPAPALKTGLDDLRKMLRFPPGYASPRDFRPIRVWPSVPQRKAPDSR